MDQLPPSIRTQTEKHSCSTSSAQLCSHVGAYTRPQTSLLNTEIVPRISVEDLDPFFLQLKVLLLFFSLPQTCARALIWSFNPASHFTRLWTSLTTSHSSSISANLTQKYTITIAQIQTKYTTHKYTNYAVLDLPHNKSQQQQQPNK